MKGSGPKIIIKARFGKGSGSGSKPLGIRKSESSDEEGEVHDTQTETATPSRAQTSDGASNDDDDRMETQSLEGTNDVNEGSEGEKEGANEAGDTAEVMEFAPMPRPRGRPRGRGKGSAPTSTPRARGRPRGSGRGRGRGRGRGGLTIKLPRRADEDGEEGEGIEDDSQLDAEDGGFISGGKPVKKILGKSYIVDKDEFVTEDDPKGDTKIDVHGNLLNGRRFKAHTFVLPNRHPERLYMLAIDAARSSGFRDSLYYFRRNPLALKLNANQYEKDHLIEVGKLGSHLRTRSVTLITARSAYKLHGAKMILDGKWVEDDYYEDKVLQEITEKGLKPGDLVGDLSEPQNNANDAAAAAQAKLDRSSGLGIYRAGGPTTIFGASGWGPYSDGPLNAVRKSLLNRDGLNEENWMHIAAQRTLEASQEWARIRSESLKVCGGILGESIGKGKQRQKNDNDGGNSETQKRSTTEEPEENRQTKRLRSEQDDLPMGIYEPHSGIVHYRGDTQPSRCRWEALADTGERRRVLGGTKVGNGAWALAWIDTVMELPNTDEMVPNMEVNETAAAEVSTT